MVISMYDMVTINLGWIGKGNPQKEWFNRDKKKPFRLRIFISVVNLKINSAILCSSFSLFLFKQWRQKWRRALLDLRFESALRRQGE